MNDLTATQQKALNFIAKEIEANGFCPSLREIATHMEYSAVGSVQDLLRSLQKKGYVERRQRGAARSLKLTQKAQGELGGKSEVLPRPHFGDQFWNIPMLGQVPAGLPAEAIDSGSDQHIVLQPSLLQKKPRTSEKLYALQTVGHSMKDAGILDGDWLIVESCDNAEHGEVIIAMTEDGEATCKRLSQDVKQGWFLKPENSDFQPIYAQDRSFTVVGRVLGLQRSFVG